MDKTKGKDLHKAVRNRGMVLIAIGTAVMGLAVFFLLHIYQNKNEEIFRTLIEENLTSTHQGQASDIEITAREILKTKRELYEILSVHSGVPVKKIEKDADRDYWLSAREAKDYGLIDEVLSKRDK